MSAPYIHILYDGEYHTDRVSHPIRDDFPSSRAPTTTVPIPNIDESSRRNGSNAELCGTGATIPTLEIPTMENRTPSHAVVPRSARAVQTLTSKFGYSIHHLVWHTTPAARGTSYDRRCTVICHYFRRFSPYYNQVKSQRQRCELQSGAGLYGCVVSQRAADSSTQLIH